MQMASTCFIIVLYCTEWLGLRQCYTLPVPTLNYYQGPPRQNWSWKYRQQRDPPGYHDKFVFPSKEPVLNIVERSGSSGYQKKDSGKIFFPDEVPSRNNDNNNYKFSDSDITPVWRIRQESSEPITTKPSLDLLTVLNSNSKKELGFDSKQLSEPPRSPLISSAEKRKLMERERVASAVQDWYAWYRERNKLNQLPQRQSIVVENANSPSSNKSDPVISDQSLVAGLQEQKCPEGQIRLTNGECRAKVEV